MDSIISSTELIKEKYIIGFNQTMQTVSHKEETKKCLQYSQCLQYLMPIEFNCKDAAETSNKDKHSLLTLSSTTTTKATISLLPTTIPPPATATTPPTTTSTTATLTTTKVSDLPAG